MISPTDKVLVAFSGGPSSRLTTQSQNPFWFLYFFFVKFNPFFVICDRFQFILG
jgi:hypothetical protein